MTPEELHEFKLMILVAAGDVGQERYARDAGTEADFVMDLCVHEAAHGAALIHVSGGQIPYCIELMRQGETFLGRCHVDETTLDEGPIKTIAGPSDEARIETTSSALKATEAEMMAVQEVARVIVDQHWSFIQLIASNLRNRCGYGSQWLAQLYSGAIRRLWLFNHDRRTRCES